MGSMQVVDVAHVIQLAVAPGFLLYGIGVFLGVLINVSITPGTIAALLVALVIALPSFLSEVRVAIAASHIGPDK